MTTMPTAAKRQSEYRKWLRKRGHRRLDIQISPKLFEQLRPYVGPDWDHRPGETLIKFLEDCVEEWDES